MTEPLHKLLEKVEEEADTRSLSKRIKDTHTEEIIIGLCGPIGSNISYVADRISEITHDKYDYEVKIIKLSDFIKQKTTVTATPSRYAEYLNELIDNGNQMRKENDANVLAQLAISEIVVKRELIKQASKVDAFKSHRTCYIINSIKNKEELELFRMIYGSLFYFIGVFANVEQRIRFLEKKGMSLPDIHLLIDRDSGEELKTGQQVTDTFMEADFFLRLEETTTSYLDKKLERFLALMFNAEISTPSAHETAMYHAFAAAGNSACLSRQVGASITDASGNILGVGWNDVPKAGGHVYCFEESDPLSVKDKRCMNIEAGKCFNDDEKRIIRHNLVDQLVKEGILETANKEKAIDVIRKSRIKELIEFSRAVHAEMLALITACQKSGKEVKGGKLFCTTYPCHNCARHILAAGIAEVYYIEPYRKSLAVKLHGDAISEDEREKEKLNILMFDGVSPRRYQEFFKMTEPRKKEGIKIQVNKRTAHPKKTITLSAIPILEKEIVKELQSKKLINL